MREMITYILLMIQAFFMSITVHYSLKHRTVV